MGGQIDSLGGGVSAADFMDAPTEGDDVPPECPRVGWGRTGTGSRAFITETLRERTRDGPGPTTEAARPTSASPTRAGG